MSTSRNKFVLLLLLALLQCFAPLLHAHTHAHTHGLSEASGVHIDGVDEMFAADSGTPVLTAERENSPAIAMAQEYRQDSTIALSDADQPVPAAPASSLSTAFFRLPFQASTVVTVLPGGPLIYSRPFSQAPPQGLI